VFEGFLLCWSIRFVSLVFGGQLRLAAHFLGRPESRLSRASND